MFLSIRMCFVVLSFEFTLSLHVYVLLVVSFSCFLMTIFFCSTFLFPLLFSLSLSLYLFISLLSLSLCLSLFNSLKGQLMVTQQLILHCSFMLLSSSSCDQLMINMTPDLLIQLLKTTHHGNEFIQ